MSLLKEYLHKRIGYYQLNKSETHTFKLHLGYSLTDGIVTGILSLNEFVFLKSLKGNSIELSFLFQFSVIIFIFLILISEWMKRVENKQRLVRISGILTRMPLALLIFFPDDSAIFTSNSFYHVIFLAIFLTYYMGNLVVFPLINLFLKSNYRHELFGPLFSYSTLAGKIVMLITAFIYGWLLDFDANSYQWVFIVAALSGTLSTIFLSSIRYTETEVHKVMNSFMHSIRESISNMRSILKRNQAFRHFEWGFMFYGLAFMSTTTVITIFFEKYLELSYFGVATYKNMYNILSLFLIPFFGHTLSKIDPRKFAALTFGSIGLFLLSLVLTYYYPAYFTVGGVKIYIGMLPYIFFHSIFAATMSLLWSVGSAYFCKPSEAADYQSVHLFLTSARSIVAPLLGVLFYELYGFVFTFALGAFLLLIAVLIMIWSYRQSTTYTSIGN